MTNAERTQLTFELAAKKKAAKTEAERIHYRNQLVELHLPFMRWFIDNKLRNRFSFMDGDDVESACHHAMVVAADRYDEKHQITFGGFAGQLLYWYVNAEAVRHRHRVERFPIDHGYMIEYQLAGGYRDLDHHEQSLEKVIQLIRRASTARTRRVLKLRFYRNLTLSQIGREVGLTKERVRQIILQGLEQIRRSLAREEYV